jgi:hypothetical protein
MRFVSAREFGLEQKFLDLWDDLHLDKKIFLSPPRAYCGVIGCREPLLVISPTARSFQMHEFVIDRRQVFCFYANNTERVY